MNKNSLLVAAGILLGLGLLVGSLVSNMAVLSKVKENFGGGLAEVPSLSSASSTAFTVTTGASVRLLASSTPTQRVAVSIQPINCAAGSDLWLRMSNDAVAIAGQGGWVQASSTRTFATYPEVPVVQGSVQGITNTGTCTVLVTEWRRNF